MSAETCGCDKDCKTGPHYCERHQQHPANPRFHAMLDHMATVHEKKVADYAMSQNPYSNFEEAAAGAGCSVDTVFMVLIGVKLARLKVLLSGHKAPNNESVQDSRLDLANYATIWASYYEGESNGT